MVNLTVDEKVVKQEVLSEATVGLIASLYRYLDNQNINEDDKKNPIVVLLSDLTDYREEILDMEDDNLIAFEGFIKYLSKFIAKLEG